MQTIFAIDGMFCGGCAHTVERSLLNKAGVTAARVSFVSDMGIVEYDAKATDAAQIRQSIKRLGYTARDLSEPSQNSSSPNRYLRALQRRIVVAVAFGMWVMIFSVVGYLSPNSSAIPSLVPASLAIVFSLPVLFFSGWPFLRLAWRSVIARVPGMELLISTAVVVALGLSVFSLVAGNPTTYMDTAVMLIVFQLFARVSDFKVRRKAQDAVRELIELTPSVARLRIDGVYQEVHLKDLKHGDVVRCHAGEVVAVDGSIVLGHGHLNVSHLSGESRHRVVAVGDHVEAGSTCVDAMLDIRVSGGGAKSVVDSLSRSVRITLAAKSDLMRLADRVAGWLLPVIFVAAMIAFATAYLAGETLSAAAVRALAVLVVTCPCALALAVPLAISAAVRTAATDGFILRDPGVLEDNRMIDVVLLDKTGTLTEEQMTIVQTHPMPGFSAKDVLRWASVAEQTSSHPIARTIVKAANESANGDNLLSSFEYAGLGVMVELRDGESVCVGSKHWISGLVENIRPFSHDEGVTQVLVSLSGQLVGAIDLGHRLMPGSEGLLTRLGDEKRRIMIVSGDEHGVVNGIARQLGVEAVGDQRPEDKVSRIRSLQERGHRVAFIGDGFNDGPALAAADLGIAVGGATGLAKSAAAIVLAAGSVTQVGRVIDLVEKGAGVIRQNLFWALVYNSVMIPAAVMGFASPIAAMLSMAVSSAMVSLNSLRLNSSVQSSGFPRDCPDRRTLCRSP